jgi:hypothetical protein
VREMHILGRPVSCGAVTLILATVLCTFPVWWPSLENQVNWIKWRRSGVTVYTIEIVSGGNYPKQELSLTVSSGKVVASNNVSPCPECEPVNLETLSGFSIDSLFNEAVGCLLVCDVKYDTQYGFPKNIMSPFMWIHVVDFKPLQDNS